MPTHRISTLRISCQVIPNCMILFSSHSIIVSCLITIINIIKSNLSTTTTPNRSLAIKRILIVTYVILVCVYLLIFMTSASTLWLLNPLYKWTTFFQFLQHIILKISNFLSCENLGKKSLTNPTLYKSTIWSSSKSKASRVLSGLLTTLLPDSRDNNLTW